MGPAGIGYQLGKIVCESGACTIEVKADPGLHFNLKAPNAVSSARVVSKSQSMFELSIDNAVEEVELKLYVCDAEETFCAERKAFLKRRTADRFELISPGVNLRALTPSRLFDEALVRAGREGKLVLVDFSAVWCPACLRLDEEVLKTPEVQALLKKFVEVRLDADESSTAALKERYHVKDMPTLLVLDVNGDERARFHGFRIKEQTKHELESVLNKTPPPLSELRKLADQGDRDARDLVGVQAFHALDMKSAAHYLSGTKVELLRYRWAELALGEDDKAARVKWLSELLSAEPSSIDAPRWALRLAEDNAASPEKAIELARAIIAQPARLKSEHSYDPSRDEIEIGIYELHAVIAQAHALAGRKEEGATAWDAAINDLKKNGKSQGQGLILLRYLNRADRKDETEDVLKDLKLRGGENYIFSYKLASFYFEQKNLPLAESEARNAYEKSFGANRLDTGVLLARILREQGKTEKSREISRETLKETFLNQASTRSEQLEELKNLSSDAD